MVSTAAPKEAWRVRAGQIGARRRWGSHLPDSVRLDALTPPQRRLVLALIAAAKEEAAPAVEPGAAQEARRASDEPA